MDQLKLDSLLEAKSPAVVSFFGAGGKTTLMYRLADEIRSTGRKVLITTTTKLMAPGELPLFIDDHIEQTIKALRKHFKNHNIAVLGKQMLEGNKISGLDPGVIQLLRERLQVTVLVEADGSRGLPIKGYAPYEPVLPACSDFIAAVIGADALGGQLCADTVHRPAEFSAATGFIEGSVITEQAVAAAFREMLKLWQLQAPDAAACCILNKSDLLLDPASTALHLQGLLAGFDVPPDFFLVSTGNADHPVRIIMNFKSDKRPAELTCVVMAAGTSTRMGEDKLFLPFKGSTILEQTLSQISDAGVSDIIVVTRPGSPWFQKLDPHKYTLVENPLYKTGMASSLQAGLSAVNVRHQGALFALADQPLIDSPVYRNLIERYLKNLKLATYPVYSGRRGNPVIFDRRVWPALMLLTGDHGGRSVLEKLGQEQKNQVKTNSSAVITDLDTPENYRDLLKSLNHRSG